MFLIFHQFHGWIWWKSPFSSMKAKYIHDFVRFTKKMSFFRCFVSMGLSVLTLSQLWTSSACHFRLTDIPDAFSSHLSASNRSCECAFPWAKIFPMDSRRLCRRLVVSQRPFGAPLRASPVYPCICFPYGPLPRWDLNIGFQLCYRSRIQKYFPANSISIHLWLINAVPEVLDIQFVLPASSEL